jgi:hypothetical protein
MKQMPDLDPSFIKASFGYPELEILTDSDVLHDLLASDEYADYNILLMTSGNFNKMSLDI